MNIVIHMVEGDMAPRYDEIGVELQCEAVTITEQGTAAHLPMVDIKMRDPSGALYLLVLTGRIVNAISAAVRGANLRNHGHEDP